MLARDGGDHLFTHESNVFRPPAAVFRRDFVRAEKRRDERGRQRLAQAFDHAQLFEFGLQLEAVT